MGRMWWTGEGSRGGCSGHAAGFIVHWFAFQRHVLPSTHTAAHFPHLSRSLTFTSVMQSKPGSLLFQSSPLKSEFVIPTWVACVTTKARDSCLGSQAHASHMMHPIEDRLAWIAGATKPSQAGSVWRASNATVQIRPQSRCNAPGTGPCTIPRHHATP